MAYNIQDCSWRLSNGWHIIQNITFRQRLSSSSQVKMWGENRAILSTSPLVKKRSFYHTKLSTYATLNLIDPKTETKPIFEMCSVRNIRRCTKCSNQVNIGETDVWQGKHALELQQNLKLCEENSCPVSRTKLSFSLPFFVALDYYARLGMSWTTYKYWLVSQLEQVNSSSLKKVPTGSETYIASFGIDTRSSFPKGKEAVAWS